jgi:hypothetical protein
MIHAYVIDGPREKPNGHLLVELLDQAEDQDFFWALVKRVQSSTGRTSKVGEKIKLHAQAIEKVLWVKM